VPEAVIAVMMQTTEIDVAGALNEFLPDGCFAKLLSYRWVHGALN